MRTRLVLPVMAIVALLVPSALATAAPETPAPAPKAKPSKKKPSKKKYELYASCDNSKPFKAARHCHYDKARLFRGTFVFESHTGKKPVKACFLIYGAKPVGGGHGCGKLPPTTYKAYPFKVTGVRQRFSVKVTWFVKARKHGAFKPVGYSFLKVTP